MRIVIIDDERIAREGLKRLLKQQKDTEVVGEAENIQVAEQIITETGMYNARYFNYGDKR